MYTQCPHCQAIFQISAEQLKAARGDVRCGQCLTVFNALHHLSEEVPEATDTDLGHDAADYSKWAAQALDTTLAETAAPPSPTATADEAAAPDGNARRAAAEPPAAEPEATVERDDIGTSGVAASWATSPSPDTAEAGQVAETNATDAISPAAFDNTAAASREPADAEPVSEEDSSETPDFDQPLAHSDTRSGAKDEDEELSSELEELEELGEIGFVSVEQQNDVSATGTTDEDEFAEFAELADEPMSSGEAIIIEETDLAPMSSQDYQDHPNREQREQDDTSSATATEQEPTVPAAAQASETSESAGAEDSEPAAQAQPAPERPVPAVILDELQAAKAERLRPSNTPWVLGTILLMLALVLQVGYYARDDLARDPTLRPWILQLCQLAGCTLSQPYDISLIDIIGRDVRSHPKAPHALIASTTLINNAPFVQPYPLLTLVFSDITGTELARRRFTPREYLSSDIDIAAGMTPNTPVSIELELVDPGKAAVNYEFHAELDPRIKQRPLSP
jgi:predicted Zn finger-like uncharacterized protein